MRYSIWVANTRKYVRPNSTHTGIEGTKIFGSEKDAPKLLEATLTEEIGQLANFTFTIAKDNAGYSLIKDQNTQVWIYEDDINSPWNDEEKNILFAGRVIHISERISNDGKITKSVICADDRDFLNDSILDREEYTLNPTTSTGKVLDLILQHNDKVGYRQGEGTVEDIKQMSTSFIGTEYNSNYHYVIDWQTTYSYIKEMCDRFGYETELVPTLIEPDRDRYYLDLVLNDRLGKNSNVVLQDGINIQELTVEKDTTNYITRLFPLGAVLDDPGDGSRLVLPTEDDDTGNIHINDYMHCIDDDAKIAESGVICGMNIWDDVTLTTNLKTKSKQYMANKSFIKVQYTGQFLDLAGDEHPERRYCLGDTHRLVHSLLGIDTMVRIVYLKRNLIMPWEVEIKLGDNFKNSQKQKADEYKQLKNEIAETYKHKGGSTVSGDYNEMLDEVYSGDEVGS